MTGAVDLSAALQAALDLLALGREERSLISGGRLEELEPLAGRRATVLRRLQAALADEPVPAEVQSVLDDVRTEGAENLALLRAVQSEVASEIEADRRLGRAVEGYGSVRRY